MNNKPFNPHNPLAGKPQYHEPAKRDPSDLKMTGAGRAKKLRATQKNLLQEISAKLGVTQNTSTQVLLKLAAARLKGVGLDNPVTDFEFAAHSYLKRLTCQTGNIIPVDSYREQLLDLVKEFDPVLAKTFARDFKNQFYWCLVGHVHRLNLEHDQLPTSVQTIEIHKKGKKRTFIARRRDGTAFPIPDGGYPRHDPCIIFAGSEMRPAIAPRDFKRLKQMDSKHAIQLLDSGKFKFSIPDNELFISDTVLNVAKPADLASIRRELSILKFKPQSKR
jgi:hypothetical protein